MAWGIYFALVRASRQSLAAAIGVGAIGIFWCWMLRPEPIGPGLLLAAVLAAIGGLIRSRRTRVQSSQSP
jgi:hypothetical protein